MDEIIDSIIDRFIKIFNKNPNEEILDTVTIKHELATSNSSEYDDFVKHHLEYIDKTSKFLQISYETALFKQVKSVKILDGDTTFKGTLVLTIKGTRRNCNMFKRSVTKI